MKRQDFLQSKYLHISVLTLEKKIISRNRIVLEIVLDRTSQQFKKTYHSIRKLSQIIQKKFNQKTIALDFITLSDNKKLESCQIFFQRVNILATSPNSQIRNFLYNFLYHDEDVQQKQPLKQQQKLQKEYTSSIGLKQGLKNGLSDMKTSIKQKIKNKIDQKQRQKEEDEYYQTKKKQLDLSTSTILTPSINNNQQKQQTSTVNLSSKLSSNQITNSNPMSVPIQNMQSTNIMAMPNNSISKFKKPTGFKDNKNLKSIFKSIQQCWVKTKKEWILHGISITQNSIVLSSSKAHDRTSILICSSIVKLQFMPYTRIMIYNQVDQTKLQIRLSPFGFQQQKESTVYEKYLALYTALKQLSMKNKEDVLNKIGIRLSIKNRQPKRQSIINTVQIPKNSNERKNSASMSSSTVQFDIKVTHQTLSTIQKIKIDSTINFYIPIIHSYKSITIQILEHKQGSILSSFMKQTPCVFQIPVQTIYDYLYNEKPKRRMPQLKSRLFDTKNSKTQVNLQFHQQGSYVSYYTSTKQQLFEGQAKPQQWNRQQSRVHINRMRRIIWKIQTYSNKLKDLLNFTKPSFSYIFYIFLILSVFFFDGNYILSYILGFMIITIIIHHPIFDIYFDQLISIIKETKVYKKAKNKFPIIDVEDYSKQYRVWHQKDKQKQRFLMNFQMTMRKKRNIYKKYKRLQELLLKAQNLLMAIANWIQKVKNLVEWYHHKKTIFALKILIGLFLFVTFLPLRYIALFGVIRRMNKGKKYHNKIRQYNRVLINEIFKLCMNEHHLDHLGPYFLQPNKSFDKKDPHFLIFQKKSKEFITQLLGLQYDHNQIFSQAKKLSQLLHFMSLSPKKYKIDLDTCKKYGFNQQWAWKPSTSAKISIAVAGFISNIPSDKYLLRDKFGKMPLPSQEENKDQDQAMSSDEFLF